MSFKDSAKGVATALRLDSHHAIERFGVIFGVLVALFAVLVTTASASAIANQQDQMDSTTLYTPSFTTSKTQLPGDVAGVYVSTDRTRALVLMHFKDTSAVSGNADKYQAFLTGSTRDLSEQPLKTSVTGEIVVFGSTGYMGMVLDSAEPFEQQILNLTMRSNSELVFRPSESRKVREDLAGQKTFAEFDQWRLYFNPGASGAQVTTALDAEHFDPGTVYNQLVISSEEEAVRADMDEQLEQMQVDLARIEEYRSDALRVNVDGVLLELPEVPEQIADDRVTGKPAVGEKASTLRFEPTWVSPRGFDFDWRDGSIESGYLDDLVDGDTSYVTFLAEKAAQSKSDANTSLRVNDIVWALSDGRLLSDYRTSDTAMKPLFEIRNDLSQAYQDYYKHKIDYQVTAFAKLLDLEVDLRSVRATSSLNDDEKALFTY